MGGPPGRREELPGEGTGGARDRDLASSGGVAMEDGEKDGRTVAGWQGKEGKKDGSAEG